VPFGWGKPFLKDELFLVAWFEVPDEWLIGNLRVVADVTPLRYWYSGTERVRECVRGGRERLGERGESMCQARQNNKKKNDLHLS